MLATQQQTHPKPPPVRGREPLESPCDPPKSAFPQALYQGSIEGRFRRIPTARLYLAWWLYAEGHITFRMLRIYLATEEMAERRRYTKPKGPRRQNTHQRPQDGSGRVLFDLAEVRGLVGGSGSRTALSALKTDIKKLSRIGLVHFTPHQITFAESAWDTNLDPDVISEFQEAFEAVPNRQRSVPVPRRTLRALAGGFGRAVTAVMLAYLIRSVFWHRGSKESPDRVGEPTSEQNGHSGRYRVDGRTKKSWIAKTFSVNSRSISTARARLIELGWLEPLPAQQWELNKWGGRHRVIVDWTPANAGKDSPPCPKIEGRDSSPCLNSSSSPTGNPKPRNLASSSDAGPEVDPDTVVQETEESGFSRGSFSEETAPDREEPQIQEEASRMRASGERTRTGKAAPPPNLRDVTTEDLGDMGRLLTLYRQASKQGVACSSEAGEIEFVAMAERARARGNRPGALFTWLVRGRKRSFITQSDEDRAARRLREHRDGRTIRNGGDCLASVAGGGAVSTSPKLSESSQCSLSELSQRTLSEDERFVEICFQVAKLHRIEDPYRIAGEARGWSRTKWDEVRLRYEIAQASRSNAAGWD